MDLSTFFVSVFTFTDDWFQQRAWQLRQRDPQPMLADSEVLTIEVVGAFLGISTNKGTFTYFRRHWAHFFPELRNVHRTTYVRQSANLWHVKMLLWRELLRHSHFDLAFHIIDSMPVPVCRFARATYCRRLRTVSAYDHDEVARQKFFGLRAHLRIAWPGVITDFELAPANVHELTVAESLLGGLSGWTLGDRNYWSPKLMERLREHDLHLLAPFSLRSKEKHRWPTELKHKRYRIETVISQLVERFQAKRVWAKDLWHFCSRWLRRILSHTLAVYLCQQNGVSSLRFANLLID
ncbi:MAG TPA: IS982 family transposase [Anaerolineae bacterium]|nr:IS982 family transposase [Anaerolineae bacterium]